MMEDYETKSDSSIEDDLEPHIPIVNKNNPYVKEINATDYGIEHAASVLTPVKYRYNENPIYISNHNYVLSEELEDKANCVKCLTLVDFIVNISYTIYGFYYPILLCIMSCCGCTGASTFDKRKIYYYLIYSYCQLLCKIYILSYLLVLEFNSKIRKSEQDKFPNKVYLVDLNGPIISSFLLLFLQFISTIQVRIFYKKIKNINPGQYIVL